MGANYRVTSILQHTHTHTVLSRIDKGSFIDLLKGRRPQEKTANKWPVLKEDYMLGAKMRDWGKTDEEEGQGVEQRKQTEDSSSSDTDS